MHLLVVTHDVFRAYEVETVGLFHNCQAAIHICNILTALDHLHPATHTQTDNSIASDFVNDTLKKNVAKYGMSDITG